MKKRKFCRVGISFWRETVNPVWHSFVRYRMKEEVFSSIFCLCLLLAAALSVGCAKSAHQTGQDVLDQIIPAELLAQVDQSISFTDLRSSPNNYIGRTVLFGGMSLKSQRMKDRTEIEILQLPMVASMPSGQRSQSEGRFIAVRSGEFLDPAVIERDFPLTVLGEVKGAVVKPLDEGEYQYPVLEIKHLINWKTFQSRERAAGYGGAYGYTGYWPYTYGPYGYDPWGYYGSSFYGPYPYGGFYPYYYGGGFSSSAPAPPPPSSVPPRFQHSR
jgi:outer membrane lipoprotein